jgi:D-amino-acid dehydrogenase
MVDFQLLSKELYSSFVSNEEMEFDFKEDGVLMMARTKKGFDEMTEMSKYANDLGIAAQKRSSDDMLKLEPLAKTDLAGGLFFPQDAHMDPSKLMESLYQKLMEMGVIFKLNHQIKGFATQKEFITHLIRVDGRAIPVTKVLLAAGSWTGKLVKNLGLKMLLQDGKGYSFTTTEVKKQPKIPGILEEAAVAVTPMGNQLRIGGSLEISGMNSSISRARAHAVISSLKDYYNNLEVSIPEDQQMWFGYRPCSADGLPYVGKYPQYQNLFVATGHAMQGMSLGPATGLLVAEMMTMKKTSLPVDLLQPDRFM